MKQKALGSGSLIDAVNSVQNTVLLPSTYSNEDNAEKEG
jgi:hypothetical protein